MVLAFLLLAPFRVEADAPPQHYTVKAGTVYDNSTRLTWQQETNPTKRSWSDATTYCAQLQLEGTGWRLPTLKELLTLVDPARTSPPVIDSKVFPGSSSDLYWSTTNFKMDTNFAWTVDFGMGNSARDHLKSAPASVRCVR